MMKSWRTSLAGMALVCFGLWVSHDAYVPYQTVKWNLSHPLVPAIALIACGIGFLHARDHKHKD